MTLTQCKCHSIWQLNAAHRDSMTMTVLSQKFCSLEPLLTQLPQPLNHHLLLELGWGGGRVASFLFLTPPSWFGKFRVCIRGPTNWSINLSIKSCGGRSLRDAHPTQSDNYSKFYLQAGELICIYLALMVLPLY